MYIAGTPDYTRDGEKRSTGLFAGVTSQDGELRTTKQNGKRYGAVSVRAFSRKDGTPVWMTIKSYSESMAAMIADLRKGDRILAAGVVETREYEGKTYTDMLADFLIPADIAPAAFSAPAYGSPKQAQPDFSDIGEEDGKLPF